MPEASDRAVTPAASDGAGVRARLAGRDVARPVPAIAAAGRPTQRGVPACRPPGERWRARTDRSPQTRSRGTRRWRRRTPMPPLRSAGSPIATSSRRALAVANGSSVPDHIEEAFGELPRVMARSDQLGNRVDNAVTDLAEAVLLAGREGDVFDGLIVDEDRHGPMMQITDPAILARVRAARVNPGDEIRVRLVAADVGRSDGRVPPRRLTVCVSVYALGGHACLHSVGWSLSATPPGRGGTRHRRTPARRRRRRGRTPRRTPRHRRWRARRPQGRRSRRCPHR